jgi:hypothetical protein
MRTRYEWDIKSYEEAAELAAKASAEKGIEYIPVDRGPCVSPRYGYEHAPKVGEPVSEAFNGDSYPAGKIIKVGKNYKRVTTDTGAVFYRRKLTGIWLRSPGGTFAMIHGTHNERNPSF